MVRDAFRTLAHGTRALTRSESDVLNVQANLTFAIHWLAPRLADFRQKHPDVVLNITTELWEPRTFAEGADVEIRYSLRPSDQVYAELLATDHYYPVCSPNYPAELSQLASEPLYDCSNMMGTWAIWAEEQSLDWPNPPVTYATTYSVGLSVAINGGGLALAHDVIARGLIERGQLIAPFAHRARMPEAYFLIESPRAREMPAAQAFSKWLRSRLSEQNDLSVTFIK